MPRERILSSAIWGIALLQIALLVTATPLPASLEPIAPENVDRLTVLARWGKGVAGGAEWTPDGRYLAVPAGLGVYLHDAQTLEETAYIPIVGREDYLDFGFPAELESGTVVMLQGEAFFDDARVRHIAFSPDGRFVAVSFAGPLVITSGGLPVVKVLDTTSWELVAEITSGWPPFDLAFSPDGRYLAVGDWGKAEVWEVQNLEGGEASWFGTYNIGENGWGGPTSLTFSPDGRWLAGLVNGKGYVWKVEPGGNEPAFRMIPESGRWYQPAFAVAFSPDGQNVLFAGDDGVLRGYNLNTGQPLPPQQVGGYCQALAFLPSGRLLYGRLDGGVVAWDPQGKREVATWKGDPSLQEVERLRVSPDGSRVLVQRAGSLLEVLDTSSGTLLGSVPGYQGDVVTSGTGYAPQASLLAFSEKDTVVLVDASSGEEVGRLRGGGYEVDDLALSPDGRLAAVSYEDEALWLWDVTQGEVRFRLKRGTEDYPVNVSAVAFSPDGRYLASVEFAKRVLVLWDPRSGRQVRVWRDVPSDPVSVAFSPDGRLLAVDGHFPNKVRLWDVSTGRTIGDISLEFGEFDLDPSRVLFSPDGRYLAAIGEGRPRMALFDLETRKLVWQGELYGETLAFSPDGRLVVGDSQGLILDGETGEVLRALVSTFSEGSGAAQFYFSPDGTKLYMIGKDGLIWVWGVPAGQ